MKGGAVPETRICIHGHFYQPPRENPWLEEIEIQDSAYPYHDWNHRITAECYARNAAARILDEGQYIVRIVNNYSRLSFNFGPTLLNWMALNSPEVYAAVLEADRLSRERFSGHGSAMAQPYNHMILPLANTADRVTQIRWGIADFQDRFGRQPEGMWLPEAAVDLETLSIMAAEGIAFTVLSPYQAGRIRRKGESEWQDAVGGAVDPRRPYEQRLPDGATMAIFFYDGPISRDVAFGGLLTSGEALAGRLLGAFVEDREEAQLVHIATDGETFGHHHRYGDMALAYALRKIESGDGPRLTNYGEFLANHPPAWETEIVENTAWSCAHGVERWRSDCGCHSGREPGWRQHWRRPLRDALDWLRDALSAAYAEQAGDLFAEPWAARDDYIAVILDRSPESVDRFLGRHLKGALDDRIRIRALKLLEMQRQAMLMYTSCGWFFDELSGIETVQVIQYAGRAVQLAGELFPDDVEGPFLDRLAAAKSNIPKHRDGRHIYEKWVKPARVDLKTAAAHFAISSLFEDDPDADSISSYTFERLDSRSADAGKSRIAVGRALITSRITREAARYQYAVFHMGEHSISCGIGEDDAETYEGMAEELLDTFDRNDIPGIFQCIAATFGDSIYSLTSLFRDEQRKVLDIILEATKAEALVIHRQLYDNNVALMRFISDSGSPVPKALYVAGELVLNGDLNLEFSREELDHEVIAKLIEDAERAGVTLDAATLEYAVRRHLERLAMELAETPEAVELLERLAAGAEMAAGLPFPVRVEEVQNRHYRMGVETYPGFRKRADAGDPAAEQWVQAFLRLADTLKIRMA